MIYIHELNDDIDLHLDVTIRADEIERSNYMDVEMLRMTMVIDDAHINIPEPTMTQIWEQLDIRADILKAAEERADEFNLNIWDL